jgi:uncharacterized membrane protein YgdD (TMEM256/DUF423 family)
MPHRLSALTLAAAALLLAFATALGAYASHGLDNVLEPDRLRTFEIAVQFQFFHSLGLLLVGLLLERQTAALLAKLAALALFAGTLLFCCGLYAASLDGPQILRSLAPIGGSTLIIGWLLLAVHSVLQCRQP